MHKVGMRQIYCLKHGYSKPKYHNLQNVLLIIVSVQRNAQTNFRILFQTRILVAGAKFNSHDSAGHFLKSRLSKMTSARKIQIFEVASKIKHAVTT